MHFWRSNSHRDLLTPDWPDLDSSSSSEMQRVAAAGNLPDFTQNWGFHLIAKDVQRVMPPRTQISYQVLDFWKFVLLLPLQNIDGNTETTWGYVNFGRDSREVLTSGREKWTPPFFIQERHHKKYSLKRKTKVEHYSWWKKSEAFCFLGLHSFCPVVWTTLCIACPPFSPIQSLPSVRITKEEKLEVPSAKCQLNQSREIGQWLM